MKINALDCSKSYQENDFPAKIIMENRDTFRIILLITSTYILKNPKVKPVFKKSCRIDEETCRPVSILPIVSKIYERLIIIRSSHHRCSVKKSVPRFSQNSQENTSVVAERLWHRCFPVNFAKFQGNLFLQNNSGRLPLYN